MLFGFSFNLKAQQIGSIYQIKPIDEKNPFSHLEKQDYYLYVHEIKDNYILFEILSNKNSSITYNKTWYRSCLLKQFRKLYVKTKI